MKRVIVKSVYDAFEYAMDHYYPFGMQEFVEKDDTYAVISIQDAHNGGFGIQFTTNDYCKDVLTLLVDDIYKEVDGAVLFNKEHAKQIFDFVEKNKDGVDTILVHCHAGQSRSAAVAAFLEKIYFGKDDIYNSHRVNDYIYKALEEAYNNEA